MKKYSKKEMFLKSSKKSRLILQYLSQKFFQFFSQFKEYNGVKVMDEEWNYLIILDACRYDFFEKINTIPGKLEKKKSLSSNTTGWLRKNFPEYYNIVYVTANPFISGKKLKGFRGTDHFFKVIPVWSSDADDEIGIVLPSKMTECAREAVEKYPNRRMIIHYIQPHGPFVGQSRVLRLNMVGLGELSLEEAKKAYRRNLKLVISEVKKLLPKLDGKVIISSDHGNCLGEKFLMGHSPELYVKELIEIPWFEVK